MIEEEFLLGNIALPEPGRSHYPRWHAPFLARPGLAEALVPGREDAFYGAFLRQSAGPEGLSPRALEVYLDAYRSPSALEASVGYYRCAEVDAQSIASRATQPLTLPTLSIGGEFAMGLAVTMDLSQLAPRCRHLQVPAAGHYPAEQRADLVNPALVAFFRDDAV